MRGNDSSMRRLTRFAVVGAVATSAHYAVLVMAVESARIPPPAAAALGAVLGAQVAFGLNRRFTFNHRGPWPGPWCRFQGVAAAVAGLSVLVVAGGTALGAHYLPAQIVATVLCVLLSFVINDRWSFRDRGGSE